MSWYRTRQTCAGPPGPAFQRVFRVRGSSPPVSEVRPRGSGRPLLARHSDNSRGGGWRRHSRPPRRHSCRRLDPATPRPRNGAPTAGSGRASEPLAVREPVALTISLRHATSAGTRSGAGPGLCPDLQACRQRPRRSLSNVSLRSRTLGPGADLAICPANHSPAAAAHLGLRPPFTPALHPITVCISILAAAILLPTLPSPLGGAVLASSCRP